jgi:ATP-dependent Lon protease
MYEANIQTRGSLPAIALRAKAPIPNIEFRQDVGRNISIEALLDAEKNHNSYVVLLVQNNINDSYPTPENLYSHGVVAKIGMKIKLPNGNFKVKFESIVRVEINEYEYLTPFLFVNFTTMPTIQDNIDREISLVKMIAKSVVENSQRLFRANNGKAKPAKEVLDAVQNGVSSDKLTDIVTSYLNINETDKHKYLSEPNLNTRMMMLLEDIEKKRMHAQIEHDIEMQVKRNIDENQREYYLRERLKAIQEQLGDKAKKDSEIEDLREAITKKKLPDHIEEKMLYELNRYQMLPSSSGESGIIRQYIDFVLELPWNEESKDQADIKKAEEALDSTHFGLNKVKERILEYLGVKILTEKNPQTILCLVGPPGVGKTTLAQSIAKALNRSFVKQSLGGVKDESEIRGHRRTYLGALPGRILNGMKKAQTVNPVFLLDEVDKLGYDYKGDPSAALLEVLDPEQNAHFSDHYLEEEYDLSKVLFIATANYLGNIPEALRDRMEVIELSSYTEIEKLNIAKEHLVNKQLRLHGLNDGQFTISDDAILFSIRSYTREAGVRQLDRLIGSLVRKAIKTILGEKKETVSYDVDDVKKLLGKEKFVQNTADKVDQIGVVTGLAYTPFGGDTLPVEVNFYKGKGILNLTGKLGDVMQESAKAALSYVKANAEKYNITPDFFTTNDIHIHVPEGAVPKDGPSAGITITTAIISACTNTYVNHLVGMTGEITLRGRVLPIGGLKEKSIAALRSGLKTILIPSENERDLIDIPDEIKQELEIIPVTNVDDVLAKVFIQ